jgi:hypothetical protein
MTIKVKNQFTQEFLENLFRGNSKAAIPIGRSGHAWQHGFSNGGFGQMAKEMTQSAKRRAHSEKKWHQFQTGFVQKYFLNIK